MQPYKQNGLWYYPALPSGMRLANEMDFIDSTGQVKAGIKFMVKSDTDPEYECHQIQVPEAFDRWRDYVHAGKIYVAQ
jgi:hypothetical protein